MLKFSVLFSVAVIFCAGRHTSFHDGASEYHPKMDIMDLITANGYPAENMTIETEDGYLLDLIRIRHGIRGNQNQQYQNQQYQNQQYQNQQYPNQQYQNQHYQNQQQPNHGHQSQQYQNQQYQTQQYQNQQYQDQQYQSQGSSSEESSQSDSSSSGSNEQQGDNRPIVLLMHGLLSSADDFIIGGPNQGLAYIMADNGYDVFMGNARGSKYGRKHTVLNPELDPAFWKFCWDDIGMKDLPAIIDKILKITRQSKIYYVGHMEGSTVFYVMASERPEYNDKIHAMITLGPVAFMGHSTNILLKLISEKQHSKGWVMRNLGISEFKPTEELISEGGKTDCMTKMHEERMCWNVYFLLNGYNSRHLNSTTMTWEMERVPAGSSTRRILHYGQLIKSGRFSRYQMDDGETRDYDLSKITTSMGMFYTPHDTMSSMEDVDKLCRKLPTLKQTIRVERLTNNMDLLYARDVADIIYHPMLKMMKNIDNNPSNNMY